LLREISSRTSAIFSDALLIAFLAASRRVERSPDPKLTHQHSIDGAVRGYVQLA
jgi:hypothetical protein